MQHARLTQMIFNPSW